MKTYKMNDICILLTDYVANGSFAKLKENVIYLKEPNYARLIRLVDYHNNFKENNAIYISKKSYDFLEKSKIFGGEIIISNVGNIGESFIAPKLNISMSLAPNCIMLKTNQNNKYIYYYFQSDIGKLKLQSLTSGSAIQKFNKTDFKKLEITIHDIDEQHHIVNILGSIDDKIENNEKIITKIDNLATLFYKKECNKESDIVSLGEYIENYDKERKPLSSRERDLLKKIYPYYGATEVVDYVDNYLFDGDYVLLGEDGTVIDAQGFPIIQRVNGKFWANNHTHILQGVNNIDNNILEVVLKNTNVKSIITGAVQLKINQSNMNKLKIILPANIHFLKKQLQPLFDKRLFLLNQNKALAKQKQLYLQKFFG